MRDRLHATAGRWQDPDEPARRQAAEALTVTTPFSEAQVAFVLNEQMAALREFSYPDDTPLTGATVGLQIEEVQPLPGFAEVVGLLLMGARVRVPDDLKFALVRAFLTDAQAGDAVASAGDAVDLVLARTAEPSETENAIVLPAHLGVAVLDGKENEEAREGLAEDVLLMDGGSARCVRVVWAPAGLSPDAYLDTFAAFRGRFPAHETLAPRVRMMTAFAAKAGLPHAYLDDHTLLVTRGAPETQTPGHLRWVEYDNVAEIAQWLRPAHRGYARNGFRGLPNLQPLGTAHRPGISRFTEALDEIRQVVAAQFP